MVGWVSDIAPCAPIPVGAALLLAGLAKALDAPSFAAWLGRLTGLSIGLARAAGPPVLAGEAALGTALVVGLWPTWTLPMALGLVLLFTAVTLRALIRGEADECGCYGGLIRLTVPWSLALDLLYLVLLYLALLTVIRVGAPLSLWPGPGWKIATCLGAGALAWALAVASWYSLQKRGRPLIIWSPIREGAAWESRWLGPRTRHDLGEGEHLVVFLSLECSRCSAWMGLLGKAVHPHPDLPRVLGVLDLPEEQRADLEGLLGFPLVARGSLSIRRLAWAMPFGVLIENGRVREIWGDRVPETFLARLRALGVGGPPPPTADARVAE